MPALTDPRREAFAQHYALNGHRGKAALEAGYSHGTTGHSICLDPAVQSRVSELVGRRFAKASITADRVIVEIARIAFADVRDLYDDEGNLLPPQDLPDDIAAVVSQIKVELAGRGKGDDRTVTAVVQVKMADKMAALTLLAKHFKIIGDEADGVNAIANILADRLNSARARDLTRGTDGVYAEGGDEDGTSTGGALEGQRLVYTLPGESAAVEDLVQAPPADPVPHQGDEHEERFW